MRPTSLISCVLLCGTAISQVVMIPLAGADDIDNTETDDMTKMVQTGAIPESLLNDILKQAGTYMSLYNTNPSQLLKGKNLVIPINRSVGGRMEKKMTSGIVSLTRPRFGKRSVVPHDAHTHESVEEAYDDILASELMSPLTKAIYLFLVNNYGTPVNNKPSRSQESKLFSSLMRPRYGKRSLHGPSAVLRLIHAQEMRNKQAEQPTFVGEDEIRERGAPYIILGGKEES